jgi:murein DD-endopeptidase MepM/ murein hydrolase activator NlpD
LRQNLTELDDLRRINRVQQAEIQTMMSKSNETAQKLTELQGLERQIQELTNPEAPSRSSLPAAESDRLALSGQGGPTPGGASDTNLPTLSALLPSDVGAYLFGQRDTLPLHLQQPSANHLDPAAMLPAVEGVTADLGAQLGEMARLTGSLNQGKKAMEDRLDYLAHLPSGYPVSGGLITDRFGTRWNPFGWGEERHEGVDLAQAYGTPVYATADGVVTNSAWKAGGYGIAVIIEHGYGYTTWYAHLSDTNVSVGDEVKRGQLIGWVGLTGSTTGPHVHYEVHVNGVAVDPLRYVQ